MTARCRRSWSPASANPSKQSIEAKRRATEVTEVVTAEDIGKMPDKNVADSLARLPGITTSAAGANEGGFDENDRVSMRGTNPSLTQTLINGHNVAAGDWFVLDQVQTVGRSVSYTLLPSEIVSKVVVRKELQRLAGRRRRGRLGRHHHAQAAGFLQAVHARSIGRRGVRESALEDRRAIQRARRNFKNDANNFGVMVAAVLRNPAFAPRRRRNLGLRHHCARAARSRRRTRICPACSTRPKSAPRFSRRGASATAACSTSSSNRPTISAWTCRPFHPS